MTRRFFAAKPLTQQAPGNNLTMGLQLSPAVQSAPVAAPVDCPECPPACVEDIVVLGWYTDTIPAWDGPATLTRTYPY